MKSTIEFNLSRKSCSDCALTYFFKKMREIRIKTRIDFHLKRIKRQLKKMNLRKDLELLKKQSLMKIISLNEYLSNIPLFKEYLNVEPVGVKTRDAGDIISDLIRVCKGQRKQLTTSNTSINNEDNRKDTEYEFKETNNSEKKNRKGQRQRRKEYELQYGNQANHLKAKKTDNLHPSWQAKLAEKEKMKLLPRNSKIVFE